MKKSILKYIVVVVFIHSIAIVSCRKDIGPIVIPPVNPPPVSFVNDIQPIFDASCVSCHDEFHQYLNLKPCCSYYELLFTGTNAPYVDTINPEQSMIYMRLMGTASPAMPFGNPLPQNEIDLVLRWIQEGAKNN